MSAPKRFEEIVVGDRASVRHHVSEDDIRRFVELTGDDNPLHVDRGYAEARRSRTSSSTACWRLVPVDCDRHEAAGTGALWVSQSFDFKAPVRLGDDIEVSATVTGKHDGQRLLELDASIVNQRGETVLAGHGKVHVLEQAAPAEPVPGLPPVAVVTGGSGGNRPRDLHRARRGGLQRHRRLRPRRGARTAHGGRGHAAGGQALAVAADLTAAGAARSCRGRAALVRPGRRRREQRLGPHHASPAADLAWADVEAHLAVQTRSALELIQAALPGMRAAGAGRIVTITSASSTRRRAAGPRTRWPRPR